MHPFNENLPPVVFCVLHDCANVLAFALVLFLHFLIPTAPALPLACGSIMALAFGFCLYRASIYGASVVDLV